MLIHFDQAFSEQTGEAFVRELARDLGRIQSLCVGANFAFGHKRGGNVALLRKLGAELEFTVHGLAAVSLDGQAVSSTRIREAIRAGDLDLASQMLGRAYSLAGTVVHGDQLGGQHRLSHRQPRRHRACAAAERSLCRARRGSRRPHVSARS